MPTVINYAIQFDFLLNLMMEPQGPMKPFELFCPEESSF